jgi:hypothetical protein
LLSRRMILNVGTQSPRSKSSLKLPTPITVRGKDVVVMISVERNPSAAIRQLRQVFNQGVRDD